MNQENQPYSKTEDFEELEKFEMNPLFYAHMVLRQIITAPHQAFINNNNEGALKSVIIGVDQLERICRADDLIKEGSPEETELKAVNDKEEIKNMPEGTLKDAVKNNAKLEVLLKAIFKTKTRAVEVIV